MNVRTKKKFSPLFLLVHLSLQPHFLSHTMDLLQRPSFLIDFVGNRKKKREKRGGKLSLLFLCRRFILSLVREDLSRARAQNSSEIDPRSRTMTIPQSSTSTRRLRARARKSTKSSSPRRRRRRRRTHERREFKRFFLSRENDGREDEKEEKQRDKERFSSLTERGENHSFSSSAIRVRILRAITAAASVAARVYSFVVCNRACVSRASEHVYRHHIILYIFVLFVCYRFCCLGVKNFSLSLFLFLRNDRQTDTHSATTRVRERSTTRER